uniref:Calcium uniporter protein C-terminal domain-containing protein n=1 Tax=Lotharella oceanica TaxID=641309 RepID=A0A7S2TWT7_9EUKA
MVARPGRSRLERHLPRSRWCSAFDQKVRDAFKGDEQAVQVGQKLVAQVKHAAASKDTMDNCELKEALSIAGGSPEDLSKYVELLESEGVAVRVSSLHRRAHMLHLNPLKLRDQANVLLDPTGENKAYRTACKERAMKELETLEAKIAGIQRAALMRTRVKMMGSSILISSYVAGVAYLTAIVFSWDTMEPITYFIGATITTISVAYAGLARQEFDFADKYESWTATDVNSCMQRDVDHQRLAVLKKYIERLK